MSDAYEVVRAAFGLAMMAETKETEVDKLKKLWADQEYYMSVTMSEELVAN